MEERQWFVQKMPKSMSVGRYFLIDNCSQPVSFELRRHILCARIPEWKIRVKDTLLVATSTVSQYYTILNHCDKIKYDQSANCFYTL